jgi:hypothetical protein
MHTPTLTHLVEFQAKKMASGSNDAALQTMVIYRAPASTLIRIDFLVVIMMYFGSPIKKMYFGAQPNFIIF